MPAPPILPFRPRAGLLALARSSVAGLPAGLAALVGLPAGAQAPEARASAALAASLTAPAPPATPVRDVTETFFGTVVHDPYRWLEDTRAPAVQGWMRAQAMHARAVLDRIPGRQALLERLLALDESVPARVTQVRRQPDGHWYYERRGAGENQFRLYRRQGLDGVERLLVNPEDAEARTGRPHALNYYEVSPDGALLAYGLSAQGSEDASLHRQDLRTGAAVGGPAITRVDMGQIGFTPDGRQFVFPRLQALRPGMPATEKYRRAAVWLLGAREPVARARRVFGQGLPGVRMSADESPVVAFTHDGRWALGYAINEVQAEFQLYLSPAQAVREGRPRWRRLFGPEAAVVGVAYMDDTLYLQSHQGAPRHQVLALRLDGPEPRMSQAVVVVPESARVVTGIAAAADALYVESREGNVKRLDRLAYAAALTPPPPLQPVALPLAGAFRLNDEEGGPGAAHPRLPGVVLDLQGWTRARQVYLVQADGQVRNTGLQPAGPLDMPDDLVATEVMVPSHDGVRVPMSVLHRRGLAMDGSAPAIVYGYGSYGATEEPAFTVSRLAWMDAGGLIAFVNPRGSGVFGQAWYEAGRQALKPNTWKDVIACAQWLVDQGYTRPARLAVWGGSAGGILVGRAITERPDLFAVAVPQVGALDTVRMELTANGAPNIPEFGSRATEAGFRALLAMSTYHQVKDGVGYPAVLLTHGVNDPRVEVWESSKTAARLQAATASGRPVLLRLDWDAGHGIGSTKRQLWEERADLYAFTLWQMGLPDWQPR